ncbi:MAG: universal stress protein, partial [Methanobrevibacter sp.]
EEDVGLIAISSSGKGRVTKFFIGSVAEKVIHSFKKDVLLVH